MTDILDRLERQWAALDPVDEYRADARDAIEEIARLRAELDRERQRRFDGNRIASEEARDEARERQGEIDRLRAELDALRGHEPVAWLIDWPDEPDLGHLLAEDRIGESLGRSRPLYLAPQPAIPDDVNTAYAAMHAPAMHPAIPDGWQLVPKEPTKEMWAAVNKLDDEMAAGGYDGKGCSIEQAWNCMLDNAPKPGDAK